MNMPKKIRIYAIVGCFIFGFIIIWSLFGFWPRRQDVSDYRSVCGLATVPGDSLTITQGTVGSIRGIRIGLISILNGRVNLQFMDTATNTTSPAYTLAPCESVDFQGFVFYVLSVKDRVNNPLGGAGSGSDSVDIFVKDQ